ncbi:hypothetical protein CP061683_1203B, partial [Chlamydia psittaci 06-1683]
RYLQE